MKFYLLILSLFICCQITLAGTPVTDKSPATRLVTGKIVDKTSGEELAGASIRVEDKVIYTDLNGNFSAIINIENTTATISSISYTDQTITFDKRTSQDLFVELEQK
jgi:hypothetical protein